MNLTPYILLAHAISDESAQLNRWTDDLNIQFDAGSKLKPWVCCKLVSTMYESVITALRMKKNSQFDITGHPGYIYGYFTESEKSICLTVTITIILDGSNDVGIELTATTPGLSPLYVCTIDKNDLTQHRYTLLKQLVLI